MDSKTLVERYGTRLEGQQWLWDDPDMTMRNTAFKPIDPEFDKEALIHWWMNVYCPEHHTAEENTPYEIYKTWSNALWKSFKFIKVDGYKPDTNQQAISLMCYKKSPLEPQLAELLMWLPHVKPGADENGKGERKAKHVSIFEHTLSEGGVYGMSVYSDTEINIGKVTYGHYRVVKSFTNLSEAVDYIRQNLWYEKGERDGEEKSASSDEDDD